MEVIRIVSENCDMADFEVLENIPIVGTWS